MKHILLLTDFSKNAMNAMLYAQHLFQGKTIKFYILHTKSPASYTTDDLILAGNKSLYNSLFKEAKIELNQIVSQFKETFKGNKFTYKTLVDYDDITDAIKQTVLSKNIDLIVMGSNGATGAKEVVFGSNTINVIRKVNCTTMVIPEGFSYRKPNNVLLPLDLEDTMEDKAFSELVAFLEKFSNKLHVLRITPNNETLSEKGQDLESIKKYIKNTDSIYQVIEGMPLEYAVSCYTQTHIIDLTALLVQEERFFDRFFTSSSTSKISKELRTPLLILHTNND